MDDQIIIGGDTTCWVFISDSDEPRHLYDIVFAISILVKKGVDLACIKIFTDCSQANLHLSSFSCPAPIGLVDLSSEFAKLSGYDHVIAVVTGHGRSDGIGQQTISIQPDSLLKAVRSIQGLKCGVMILCQCFAGIFNFLDAVTEPKVVIIGATNLASSLSPPIVIPPITGVNGAVLSNWNANAFMFYFFKWIGSPIDIDGDGNLTLVDAYKYAGAESTSQISSIKSEVFVAAHNLVTQINTNRNKGPLSPIEQIAITALETTLGNFLSILNVNQEPWLLHAHFARRIAFQ